MHPILFQIGSLTIYSYGVLLAVAVLLCALLLGRDAQAAGFKRETIYDLVFWVMLGGLVGARIFYILITWDYFSHHLWEMVMLNRGGLAWQGGFLGGAVAGLWFVKSRALPLRKMLDLSAPYVALGQAIGRIGCFLNGCCYGKECDLCLYFPVHHVKLYPTQLYEAGSLFFIFIILKLAQQRLKVSGMVFVLYLWLAAIERFVVEFYRADHDVLWLGLSLSQYIAVAIFLSGIVVFFRFRK